MKIVIDCGNGVAGGIAPQLFRALGCELVELFCEVDGNFPNHHPDPSKAREPAGPHRGAAAAPSAELGLAFDGDGDRLGVVTRDGEIIYPDRQLMLFAADVLAAAQARRSSTMSNARACWRPGSASMAASR
jgi:phosphomannomutase/phosphoglucomutase